MNQIFKDNPKVDIYYTTSDGTPFFSKNAAQNHAKTLEQKNIETITRGSVVKDAEPEVNINVDTGTGDSKTAEITVGNLSKDIVVNTEPQGNPDELKNKVQEVVEKGAEGVQVVSEKLTPKQLLQAEYEKKFNEAPADEFTKAELSEAIEKGEKLVAKPNNEQ